MGACAAVFILIEHDVAVGNVEEEWQTKEVGDCRVVMLCDAKVHLRDIDMYF